MPLMRPPRRPARNRVRLECAALEPRTLLSCCPPVAAVAPLPAGDVVSSASNQSYESVIHAQEFRALYSVNGAGLTAAVIDTGVNYRHPALGAQFGPTARVVGGYDFGDRDADPDASTWQHGTAVAGLIASSDPLYPGVAPGADIVALRVFDSANLGNYQFIIDSLQWVIDHREEFQISVVNLSIADGRNYLWNTMSYDGGIGQKITELVDQLRAVGVPVVSAAGNSYSGKQGMGFTAILPNTISVTSSTPGDEIVSNAQRLGLTAGGERATDLVAPGTKLAAPTGNGGFQEVEGTSFSTPLVSGSILLLQSLYKQRFGVLPSVDQVESWLELGGKPIVDGATGITLPRLDLLGAGALVPQAPAPPPPPVQPPAPPVEPPPPSEPPVEVALTDLYRNGQYVGAVPSASAANPLNGFFTAFGRTGRFTSVHTWEAASRGDTGTPAPVGTNRASLIWNGSIQQSPGPPSSEPGHVEQGSQVAALATEPRGLAALRAGGRLFTRRLRGR